MPEHYWVDTNVILRFITQSPDHHAKLATQIMEGVDRGQFVLHVHPLIIAECCYVLQGGMFKLPHEQIASILKRLILSDGIETDQEEVLLMSLEYYEQHRIDFEDAYLAAHAETHPPKEILTFNVKDFAHTRIKSYSPEDILN